MIDMKLTGCRIRQECRKQGITVKQIQEKLHIGSFQSVYNWFCGKTLPSVDNLLELSKLLHVPMESLLIEETEDTFEYEICYMCDTRHLYIRMSKHRELLRTVIQLETE